MVGLMAVMTTSFKRTYARMRGLPGLLYLVPLTLGRPLSTHTSTRLPNTHWQVWLSLLGSCPFSWVLVCTRFCLCPPSARFLWKFCSKYHWTSKSNSLGSQSLCQISRLGILLWVLELLQQCKNVFGIIVLQSVGHLLSGSMVGLVVTSSRRAYATRRTSQVCCSQSSCPRTGHH